MKDSYRVDVFRCGVVCFASRISIWTRPALGNELDVAVSCEHHVLSEDVLQSMFSVLGIRHIFSAMRMTAVLIKRFTDACGLESLPCCPILPAHS
jgi:hypothetical protein